MKCDNELCLFQRADTCTRQDEITINGLGRCDQCVLMSPPAEVLGMMKAACLFSFLNTSDEDVSDLVEDDLAAIVKQNQEIEREEQEEQEEKEKPKTKGKPQPKSKANAKARAKEKAKGKNSDEKKKENVDNIIPFP